MKIETNKAGNVSKLLHNVFYQYNPLLYILNVWNDFSLKSWEIVGGVKMDINLNMIGL